MSRLVAFALVCASAGPVLAQQLVSTGVASSPDIVWSGDAFGVTYRRDGAVRLAFNRLREIGSPIAPEVLLPFVGSMRAPVVDVVGGLWVAALDDSTNNRVNVLGFLDDGTIQFGPVQLNSLTPVNFVGWPSLAWNGSGWLCAWSHFDGSPSRVDIASFDMSGNIVMPDTILVPANRSRVHLVANAASGGLVGGWEVYPGTGCFWEGANLTPGGSISGSIETLSPVACPNYGGRLAATASGFASGYQSGLTTGPGGRPDAYFTPLDLDMMPTSAPVRISQGLDLYRTGSLVWTGAAFIWPVEDSRATGVDVSIYRMTREGVLLGGLQDINLIGVPAGAAVDDGPRAAMGERVVGVVFQSSPPSSGVEIYYQYVPTTELLAGAGAGPSSPPRVRGLSAFQAAGVLDFLAYGGTGYGVNVASGDIGSGQLHEILTGPGPGPGYGPQVRAFTGGQEAIAKVNFYAYGTLKGGVLVGSGDLDLDGFEEIVTGAGPVAVFGPHVRGFDYDGASVQPMPKVSFYAYGTLKYGVEVASGDVEADGYAEILTGPGPGQVFGAHLRGFDYDGATVAPISGISTFPFPTRYGLHVGAGDVTGIGREEILVSAGPDPAGTSEVKVMAYTGTVAPLYAVTPFASPGGTRMGAADMTVDASEEIVVTPGALATNVGRTKAYKLVAGSLQEMPAWDQDLFPGQGYGATCAIGNVGI